VTVAAVAVAVVAVVAVVVTMVTVVTVVTVVAGAVSMAVAARNSSVVISTHNDEEIVSLTRCSCKCSQ
jgi:hypothetical protein